MHKCPKDNWPWPKLHQLCTENQPLVPQIGPICWVWMDQRKKLWHSLPLQQQSPCPFLPVTNSTAHWECKGGMQGSPKAAQLCAHCSSPLPLQGKAIPYMASHAKAVALILVFLLCFFWWQGQVVYKWKWTQEREYGIDSLLQLPVTKNTVRDLPGSVAFLNSMVHIAIKLPCTYICCSSLTSTLGGLAKNYLSKKKWSAFCFPVSFSLSPPILSSVNRAPPYKQDH